MPRFPWALCLVGLISVVSAHAEISNVTTFRTILAGQVADGPALVPAGEFFSTILVSSIENEFDAVGMAFTGPTSPVGLTGVSTTQFVFQSPLLPTGTLDSEFPPGTYVYVATNSGGDNIATVNDFANFFGGSFPFLAGTTFSDAQGLNVTQPFFFEFGPYLANPFALESFIFFRLIDTTSQATVFEAGFLDPTTPGVTVPEGTLLPNQQYQFFLTFSDRLLGEGTGASFAPLLAFDLVASGSFATAVPEPSSALLMGGTLALASMWVVRQRAAK